MDKKMSETTVIGAGWYKCEIRYSIFVKKFTETDFIHRYTVAVLLVTVFRLFNLRVHTGNEIGMPETAPPVNW